MQDPILVASIAFRLAGVAYSLVLLYRVRDRRFAFLTVMLSLMAIRQLWTLDVATGGLSELPGLVVSVFAILTVYYLSQYVEQEAEQRRTLAATNDRLRSFRKAIEHAGHAIFTTDPDGTITYANPATEDVTGYDPASVIGKDPSIWNAGHHDDAFFEDMWATIQGGDVWQGELVNENRNGDHVWVDMTIAPITGPHGEIEQYVAVDTDITERKRQKHRIEAQHERLVGLNHTNKVLRDVNQHLVEASDRDGIEAGICAEFAAAPPYEFAGVVTRNHVTDTLSVRTVDGIEAGDLDAFLDAMDAGENPVRRALEDDRVAIVDDVAAQPWEHLEQVAGCETLVAVPIQYGETTYGALVIGEQSDALRNLDSPVLAELGETIGYAINAVESKQALLAERVTEIEFSVVAPACPAVCLADRLDCTVALEWLTRDDDGDLVAYYDITVPDTDTELQDTEDLQVVTRDDDRLLVRVPIEDTTIASTLADHGAILAELTAVDGAATCTAVLPEGGDVRVVLDALGETHGAVQLLAQRDRERPSRTIREVHAALVDALTDRQQQVLRTAYVAGFFEWPRQNSGEDVASMLSISQSTFLQHLRVAERKLLDVLFADEAPDPELVSRSGPGRVHAPESADD